MNLQGKIINFLGDSITEGQGVSNIEENRYDHVIKKATGLKAVYNYGLGGTRIAYQRKASLLPFTDLYFCGRAYFMNKEADIVVVFGGTNDYGHGDAPFGIEEDTTPDTFCGAVEFLMNFLKERYKGKDIVFMTPCRRVGDENGINSKPLCAYVDVIKQKGLKHQIPVLDLYNELEINPNLKEDREKYAPDGLHLNDAGHAMLAQCLMGFLQKL